LKKTRPVPDISLLSREWDTGYGHSLESFINQCAVFPPLFSCLPTVFSLYLSSSAFSPSLKHVQLSAGLYNLLLIWFRLMDRTFILRRTKN
jgi:hypothetical protein